jgi:hypothetical protein
MAAEPETNIEPRQAPQILAVPWAIAALVVAASGIAGSAYLTMGRGLNP